MKIRTEMTLAAVLAVGLLAFAFATSASAFNSTQTKFKVEVKGVQTYSSSYNHASNDPCDPTINSLSRETIKFASTKPVTATFTRLPGVKDPVITSGTRSLRIPTKAKIKRSNSYSASGVGMDCPDNGGGVPGGETPSDCGTRVINPWYLSFDYYKRDHVALAPEDVASSDPFKNCGSGTYPRLLDPDSFGRSQVAELPVKEVFDPKIGKLITIGRGTQSLANPEGDDDTKLRWEISLTRIK